VRRLPWRVAALALLIGLVDACASLPPVRPSESTTSTPVPTPAVAVTVDPTVAPATRIFCGRIAPVDCQSSIELVRGSDPVRVAAAEAIVVDDTCPPAALCDRLNPFEVLVMLVSGDGITAGFMVFGRDGPEQVALGWPDPLPAHIAAAVAAAVSG
jgi:hypothetical protein